jgi:pSer/pThr/pTyr-binding forkhead associated (FHA) protein
MIAICPACTHENRPNAFFCAQCGTKVHFDSENYGRFVRMNGPHQDRRLDIPGPVCEIGRDPGASLRLEEDSVSKHHARLTRSEGEGYEIEDLDSSNGTFVNGRRIHGRTALRPGDLIRLGAVILKLEV